jgi:hypothetical protein
MPSGLAPSDLFGANETFAVAFASFLRRNPEAWRVRRTDRFRPVDLHLADHEIALQGRVDPGLLQRFAEFEADPPIDLDQALLRKNESLTVYLPAIVQSKRLHLGFSVHRGRERLPRISHFESARITAVHLLTILIGDRDITVGEARRLHRVLTTLAFQNPVGLEQRIGAWVQNRPKNVRRAWEHGQALEDEQLLEWIHAEAEGFLEGLGPPLRAVADAYLKGASARAGDSPPYSLAPASVSALGHFGDVTSLLLHDIRDVLKTLVSLAPVLESQAAGTTFTRQMLMERPERLARHVEDQVLRGLDSLLKLLKPLSEAPAPTTVREEFQKELEAWTVYIPLDIALGRPFTLRFRETISIGPRLNFARQLGFAFSGSHLYPIPLKDADGVHVEVEIPDPALQLGRRLPVVALIPGQESAWRQPEIPMDTVFGSVERASERFVHLYSSRMRREATQYDRLLPYLRLKVRLRLTWAVLIGHLYAATAFLLAALYIGSAAIPHAVEEREIAPQDLRVIVTVGALTVTVSLWLTAIQYPRPVTFKKLTPARMVLYLALLSILVSLGMYFGSRAFT